MALTVHDGGVRHESMTPILTLHHGDAEASFSEHPTETARKALIAAARIENPRLADQLRRFAETLPRRGPIAGTSTTQEGASL